MYLLGLLNRICCTCPQKLLKKPAAQLCPQSVVKSVLADARVQPEGPAGGIQSSIHGAIIAIIILLGIFLLFYLALFKTEWRQRLFSSCDQPDTSMDERRQNRQAAPYELNNIVQNSVHPAPF